MTTKKINEPLRQTLREKKRDKRATGQKTTNKWQ